MIAGLAFTVECHGSLLATHQPVSERLVIRGGSARVVGGGDEALRDGVAVRRSGPGTYHLTAITPRTPEFDVYGDLRITATRGQSLHWYSKPHGGEGPIQAVSAEQCHLISGKIPA